MRGYKRWLPALVLVAGLAAALALGLDEYLSLDALREHRAALTRLVEESYLATALGFCAVYAAATAFSVPGGAFLTLTGGFLFGAVAGAAFSVAGATTGAVLVFLAARTAFAGLLRARAGSAVERMRQGFQENALSYMLFLRLIPAFPFFLVNLAPAFLGVRLGVFALGTFVGIIPGSFVYALVGAGLGEIFDAGGAFSIASVLSLEIALGLAGLGVLALLPIAWKRLRRPRGEGA